MTSPIAAVAVVIPVHDEEQLLGACLASVEVAAHRSRVPVHVVVVLDRCTDGSAAIASRSPFHVVGIEAAAVGAARRTGVSAALAAYVGVPRDAIWLAHTDADSTVPPQWITEHMRAADAGADVLIGTVQPDFADLSPDHSDLWMRTHPPGQPNGHVHGANLGIRASVYAAAGGFSLVEEHEDVTLVERARALDAKLVPTDDCRVITSGRLFGRTPGGYAGYLRHQAENLAPGSSNTTAIINS